MTVVGSAVLELLGDSAQFRAEMQKAVGAFQKSAASMGAVGAQLTRAVSLPLLAVGVGAVAAATKMDTLKRALVAVSGSTDAAERQLGDLREAAKLPGLGFAEAVEGSVRLQAVGVEAGRATRLLKAFGNAIATTGGGKNELRAVTVQLGQLSAKGKILAQDLRPIIEAAPAVGKALKDAFGTVDAQDIEKLGLSTDEFLDKLVAQLERLPSVTGGPKNAFENLQDSLLRAGDAVGKVLLPSVVAFVDKATSLLEKVETLNPATIKLAVGFGVVAAAIGPLLIGLSRLVIAFNVLLPFMGPAGLIVAGITAVVAAFGLWKAVTSGQTAEMQKLASAVDDFNVILAQTDPAKQLGLAQNFASAVENDLRRAKDRLENLRLYEAVTRLDPQARASFIRQIKEQEANVADLTQRLNEANAAVGRLQGSAGSGGGKGLGEDIKNALDDLRASLRQAEILNQALGTSFDRAGFEADAYKKAVEDLSAAGVSLNASLGREFGTLGALAGKYQQLNALTEFAANVEAAHNKLIADGASLTQSLLTPVERRNAAEQRANELLAAGAIDRATYNRAMAEAARITEALNPETAKWAAALADVQSILQRIIDPAEVYKRQVAILTTLFQAGAINIGLFSAGLAALKVQFDENVQTGQQWGDTLAQAGVQVADSFASFATSASGSFHDFAMSVERDIARIILRFAILKGITAFLTAINPGLGAEFGAAAGIRPRAAGGPVRAGRPYLVGEKGPELFMPRSSGMIRPNAGGPITVRFDASSLPPQPRALTPEALAQDDYWRRAFTHLKLDYDQRGGL